MKKLSVGISTILLSLLLITVTATPAQSESLAYFEDATITDLTINSGETLDIAGFATVTVTGTIQNYGTISVGAGTLINKGTINNHDGGLIDVRVTLDNQPGAVINNNAGGIINSLGVIDNKGTIENSGTPYKLAKISLNLNFLQNSGTINNNPYGQINNGAEIKNLAGGVITNFENAQINSNNKKIDNQGTIINHCGGSISLFTIISGNPIQEDPLCKIIWDGGGDGVNWSDPTNWNLDRLPTSTDTILINDNAGNHVNVNLDIDFTLDNGGSVIIDSGDWLWIKGTTLSNLGHVLNNGKITISNPTGKAGFENKGTIENHGIGDFNRATTAGVTNLLAQGIFEDTIINYAEGKINNFGRIESSLQNDGVLENSGTLYSYIVNSGTITNSMQGKAVSQIIENNSGGIIDNSGRIEINWKDFLNSGIINNKNSGVIGIYAAFFDNKAAGTINNEGRIEILQIVATGSDIHRGIFSLDVDPIKSSTDPVITDGIFSNTGSIQNSAKGVIEIVSGSLENFGTVNNLGKIDSTYMENSGTINNNLGGIFSPQFLNTKGTVNNDGTINLGCIYNEGTFPNTGTFISKNGKKLTIDALITVLGYCDLSNLDVLITDSAQLTDQGSTTGTTTTPTTPPPSPETKTSIPPNRISESDNGYMTINDRDFNPTRIEETEVKLAGQIKDYKYGTVVMLEIQKPDGTIVEKGIGAKSDGTFDTKITLDETWEPGKYVIKTKYNEDQIGAFSIEIDMKRVPTWIKNNAKWWSDDQIDDNSFVQGIQYLIKENILRISGQPPSQVEAESEIPSWIKKNAGWWADGMISESDFVKGIQYLVENGIVQVN